MGILIKTISSRIPTYGVECVKEDCSLDESISNMADYFKGSYLSKGVVGYLAEARLQLKELYAFPWILNSSTHWTFPSSWIFIFSFTHLSPLTLPYPPPYARSLVLRSEERAIMASVFGHTKIAKLGRRTLESAYKPTIFLMKSESGRKRW